MGYGPSSQPSSLSEVVMSNQESADCLVPMGITSENVAAQYKITREEQDVFAAESFSRAAKAQKAGKFKSEIVPVKTRIIDPKTEKESEIVVDSDDGIRDGVTKDSLAKLKPAFSKTGSTHAGNASQVSDGAAAVLLARRSVAKRLGLPILGRFVTASVVGVPPRIMGIGPAVAIPAVLKKVGLRKEEVDFYEINEAFASQAVMSVKTIGIPFEKVNLKYVTGHPCLKFVLTDDIYSGGAIAIGHPLGATGARQVATGYALARDQGGKVFVTSMCVGSGMVCCLLVNALIPPLMHDSGNGCRLHQRAISIKDYLCLAMALPFMYPSSCAKYFLVQKWFWLLPLIEMHRRHNEFIEAFLASRAFAVHNHLQNSPFPHIVFLSESLFPFLYKPSAPFAPKCLADPLRRVLSDTACTLRASFSTLPPQW